MRQPQPLKLLVAGNHDTCFEGGETDALLGATALAAGARPRMYFAQRHTPALYMQDESAVVRLTNGNEIRFYGTPWHPRVGGVFEFDPSSLRPTAAAREAHPTLVDWTAAMQTVLSRSWGPTGRNAHVVRHASSHAQCQ